MKILYVLNHTIPDNGATKAILGLVNSLRPLGVTPCFLMPDKKGIYKKVYDEGYEVITMKYRLNAYPSTKTLKDKLLFPLRLVFHQILNMLAWRKLTKLLGVYKIDIVHTNVSVVNVGMKAAMKQHIPHIFHVREYADLDFDLHYIPSWKEEHKKWANKRNICICITNNVAKHHGIDGKQYAKVIYDGVHPAVKELPAKGKGNYFLYAGRIEFEKGLDILIRAYARYASVADKPLKLMVAGSVSEKTYFTKITQLVEKLQVKDSITFLGCVEDISSLMHDARALIIPSRNEGFGFCMPEAMFVNCLCIAHSIAGTKEQLDNGIEYTGKDIALSFNNEEELAKHLENVGKLGKDEFEEMRQRAFETVNGLYSQEHAAKSVYEIYRSII